MWAGVTLRMEAGETQLLEVLIAKDRTDRKSKDKDTVIEDVSVPVSAASFSAGSKASNKKGILKKGLALRRASSLTSGKYFSVTKLKKFLSG